MDAEEVGEKGRGGVAGNRDRCRYDAGFVVQMMENGGGAPSPGHLATAPLPAKLSLSAARSGPGTSGQLTLKADTIRDRAQDSAGLASGSRSAPAMACRNREARE